MQARAREYDPDTPETLVSRLANRLRQHALWDVLLVALPLLIAGIHSVAILYWRGWIPEITFIFTALAAAALTVAFVLYRYRSTLPSPGLAAHLIDQRAEAADRFITLATLEGFSDSPSLVGRLRSEASGLLRRVSIKRDFPYKVKRTFYRALLAAVLFAGLLHLFVAAAGSPYSAAVSPGRLREIAAKMAQRPGMSELARQLQRLATTIQEPKISPEQKQAAVQEMQKKIEQQRSKEDQKENRDLLDQAASALGGVDQQQGDGQQQKKDEGGGGIQSNIPEKGQGEAKPSPGSGDGKGDVSAKLNKDMQDGKPASADPKEHSADKNQAKAGEGKGEHPDPSKADRDQSQEISGKTQGEREDRLGKNKAAEDIPQGAPPAERFNRPGEGGSGGLKDARYVTVQLPEEMAADSKGASGGTRDSKGNQVGPKLPVSNVPLPPHLPDAPAEKQQLPLEYRGIIR